MLRIEARGQRALHVSRSRLRSHDSPSRECRASARGTGVPGQAGACKGSRRERALSRRVYRACRCVHCVLLHVSLSLSFSLPLSRKGSPRALMRFHARARAAALTFRGRSSPFLRTIRLSRATTKARITSWKYRRCITAVTYVTSTGTLQFFNLESRISRRNPRQSFPRAQDRVRVVIR